MCLLWGRRSGILARGGRWQALGRSGGGCCKCLGGVECRGLGGADGVSFRFRCLPGAGSDHQCVGTCSEESDQDEGPDL